MRFLTTEQCKKLLSTAETYYPQAVASYAVLLFSGLRPSEFARLRTEDVSPEGIEVNAESKIGKRRHITPIETLKIWLEKLPFERVSNWRRVDQAVRYLAGWDVWTDPDFFVPPAGEDEIASRPAWPQDATRHTFGTYSINSGVVLDHFYGNSATRETPGRSRRTTLAEPRKSRPLNFSLSAQLTRSQRLTAGALVSAGTALATTTGKNERPTKGTGYMKVYYNGEDENGDPVWIKNSSEATTHGTGGYPTGHAPADLMYGNNLGRGGFNWTDPKPCGANDPKSPSDWTKPPTAQGSETCGSEAQPGGGYKKFKQQKYIIDVTAWS